MDHNAAELFAAQWEQAWNDHDIDRLLSHFDDNVRWTSPVAAHMVPSSGGVIVGKSALGEYFNAGLSAGLEVHFEVLAVYCGLNCLVINYRNQRNGLADEVLIFGDEGLVTEGHGTYLSTAGPEQGLPGTP